MIAAIAIRPRRPSRLAAEIGLSRPAVSRQLHLLHDAGLIRASRFMGDRRSVLYGIEPRSHGAITAWLAGTEIARPTTGADVDTAPSDDHEIAQAADPEIALRPPRPMSTRPRPTVPRIARPTTEDATVS